MHIAQDCELVSDDGKRIPLFSYITFDLVSPEKNNVSNVKCKLIGFDDSDKNHRFIIVDECMINGKFSNKLIFTFDEIKNIDYLDNEVINDDTQKHSFTTPEICQQNINRMRELVEEFKKVSDIQFPIVDSDYEQFQHYTVNQIQETLKILSDEINKLQNDLDSYILRNRIS